MSERILIHDEARVRRITLNRPDKRNALDTALTTALLDALRTAADDAAVGAVVLTGAGSAFCAGADLAEFREPTADRAIRIAERARLTTTLQGVFRTMRVPVVAAVNGVAMGGGAGLALACDLAVAADGAEFAYPEVNHGMVAAIVMAQLVRTVGTKVAFELAATGRRVTATEALALHMVNAVVPAARVVDEAHALAAGLAEVPARALALTKSLVYGTADVTFDEALELGRAANETMRGWGR